MEGLTAITVAIELALVASVSTSASPSQLITKTDLVIAQNLKHLRSTLRTLASTTKYHLKTLLLFIYSDLKQVTLPWTLFGIAHALAAHLFHIPTASNSTSSVLCRFPIILTWILINLLPFCIGNQRHPTAVAEDTINKSWRPIPSKRITPIDAKHLMLACYIVAFLISNIIGGTKQCVTLGLLGYAYNDLNLGDKSFITRGLLNGLGFVSFGSGAMEVALGQETIYTPELTNWLAILVVVIATGIQTMDMYDQEGDRTVGRSTLPLVIGDVAARWSIVVGTLLWSVVCPWYWGVGWVAQALVLAGGIVTAMRCLRKRDVKSDKKTAKVWNLWLVGVYCLPLMKTVGL